jgi:hypothetical protein
LKTRILLLILTVVALSISIGPFTFRPANAAGTLNIVSVVACDASGTPQNSLTPGKIGYFKVTYDYSGSDGPYVLFTANVYDVGNNPVGVACSNVSVSQGESSTILSLLIPKSAAVGNGTVYADAYTDWPANGGLPLCPEVSAVFLIDPPLLPGDVTGPNGVPDGKVNMMDITAIIAHFGTKPTSPNWNPIMDINKDGVVNIRDLAIAICNYSP